MKTKQKILFVLLLIIAAAGWFFLPDEVESAVEESPIISEEIPIDNNVKTFADVPAESSELPAAAKTKTKASGNYAIGFYNVENLFDTIPGSNNDADFLPDGEYRWNSEKYVCKLSNIARVLNELGTDRVKGGCAVIGLAEVENRTVVEDLVNQEALRKHHLKILHYESPDPRGIDCAMLYDPKQFVLEDSMYVRNMANGRVVNTRGFLVGIGTLAGDRMAVIVNHWPSRGKESEAREHAAAQVYKLKEDLLRKYGNDLKIVIMGDLNDDPDNLSVTRELKCVNEPEQTRGNAHELYNPWFNTLNRETTGTLTYKGKWNLFDQIIISGNLLKDNDGSQLSYTGNQIFYRDWLIQQSGRYKGSPLRTFSGNEWLKGYSDHLPTCIYLTKKR